MEVLLIILILLVAFGIVVVMAVARSINQNLNDIQKELQKRGP